MRDFIYSAEPGLLIGFHGCERSVRDDIIFGKKQMKSSNNSWDWLGDGTYFWQNNYERALHYANHPPGNLKIKEPAVLGAVFSLGNCLDLTDKKSLDIVKTVYGIYRDSFASQGKVMPVNSNPSSDPYSKDHIIRRLDCAVIKKVHESFFKEGLPPFDSVRALFPEGDALYTGAGFRESTHIQIAIRNPNMIKGYFLPRRETKWSSAPLPLPVPTKSRSASKKPK
jgi:hypothetical protein